MGRDGSGVSAASASSIQITFQYQGKKCREVIALQPSPANLKRAEQFRAAVLHSISIGTFDYATTFPKSKRAKQFAATPGQALTVEEYFTSWLKSKKQQTKASSFDGYRKIVDNLVIPQFGALTLASLKRKDIREWLEGYEASNKRLRNIQSVMRSALNDAVHEEILEANPLTDYCFQRMETVAELSEDEDVDPFTPAEQAMILEKCCPQLHNQTQVFLWTGLRTSELIALDWADVDFAKGEIRVRKAMTTAGKGIAEIPKTATSRRVIKMLGPTRAALQAQKAFTHKAGKEVFQNPNTRERWSGDQNIRDAWVRILAQTDVQYRRPYQTRHTFASMMLSAGEHPMWVAKQMGHSDWTMIARVYGRWIPQADNGAGSKAEALFGATKAG